MDSDHTPLPITEEHTLLGERTTSRDTVDLNPRELRPALLVQRGPRIGDWFPMPEGPAQAVFGRDRDVDFRIKDASVSRQHARFTVEGGRKDRRVFVEDLGSTNGTRVGSDRIKGAVALHEGDLIYIGDVVLRYRLMDAEDRAFQKDIAEQVRNARKDPLTRLYSRRYLDDQLPGLIKAHRRNDQPMSLIIADLDHFKSVNDVHGHLVGDEVLWRVAEAIRSTVRMADSPVRYGGEEFCVVLPGASLVEALIVAERVRAAVERLDLGVVRDGLTSTISLGVACLSPDEEQQEWMQRADVGLYEAKRQGRNRVASGPPPSPSGENGKPNWRASTVPKGPPDEV